MSSVAKPDGFLMSDKATKRTCAGVPEVGRNLYSKSNNKKGRPDPSERPTTKSKAPYDNLESVAKVEVFLCFTKIIRSFLFPAFLFVVLELKACRAVGV